AQARSSSHLISGWAWMRWLSSTSSGSTRSKADRAAALAAAITPDSEFGSGAAVMGERLVTRLGGHDRLDGPGQRVGGEVGWGGREARGGGRPAGGGRGASPRRWAGR